MKISSRLCGLTLLAALAGLNGCASTQPKLTLDQVLSQYTQVANLNNELKEAREKGSQFLAPEGYAAAQQSLESAMNAAYNNKSTAANEKAAEGLAVVKKMKADTASSRQILKEVLVVRERAMTAGVGNVHSEKLAELDEDLKKTASLVEDGDLEKAKQRRPELLKGYIQLELATLKQGTAEQARSAIANAIYQDAEKYAPKTIAQAEEKLAIAESILDIDRTQTDKADVEASKAK